VCVCVCVCVCVFACVCVRACVNQMYAAPKPAACCQRWLMQIKFVVVQMRDSVVIANVNRVSMRTYMHIMRCGGGTCGRSHTYTRVINTHSRSGLLWRTRATPDIGISCTRGVHMAAQTSDAHGRQPRSRPTCCAPNDCACDSGSGPRSAGERVQGIIGLERNRLMSRSGGRGKRTPCRLGSEAAR
jgi:hypothetical protein